MSARQFFQTQRLVLREHPGEHAVDAHATSWRWPRIREVDRIPAERSRAVVWEIECGLTLHYAEDDASPVSYVFVRSETPGVATTTLGALREALNPWSLDELIASSFTADEPGERARSIARVVIAAPHRADPRVLRRIKTALDDDSVPVRQIGIGAMVHLLWPECRPLLAEVSAHDPERELRRYAKAILRDFDRLGVDGT